MMQHAAQDANAEMCMTQKGARGSHAFPGLSRSGKLRMFNIYGAFMGSGVSKHIPYSPGAGQRLISVWGLWV